MNGALCRTRSLRFGTLGFVLGVSLVAGGSFPRAQTPSQEAGVFQGTPLPQALERSGVIRCFSDRASVSGYHRDETSSAVTLSATALAQQSAGGWYRITLGGRTVTVDDEAVGLTSKFDVNQRRDDGLVLVRTKSIGVEIITIDPLNGSFVLTDTGIQRLWNRTNVWVGRCEAAAR